MWSNLIPNCALEVILIGDCRSMLMRRLYYCLVWFTFVLHIELVGCAFVPIPRSYCYEQLYNSNGIMTFHYIACATLDISRHGFWCTWMFKVQIRLSLLENVNLIALHIIFHSIHLVEFVHLNEHATKTCNLDIGCNSLGDFLTSQGFSTLKLVPMWNIGNVHFQAARDHIKFPQQMCWKTEIFGVHSKKPTSFSICKSWLIVFWMLNLGSGQFPLLCWTFCNAALLNMSVQCFRWSVSSNCSCDAFAFAVDKMCYLTCEQKSRM